MEPKRYWWLWYMYKKDHSDKEYKFDYWVVDIHPFIYMESMKGNAETHLRDWKLISAEEYELWHRLNNA